jgi:hypothetical protein
MKASDRHRNETVRKRARHIPRRGYERIRKTSTDVVLICSCKKNLSTGSYIFLHNSHLVVTLQQQGDGLGSLRHNHHQVAVPMAKARARKDEKVLETPSAPSTP